MPRQKIVERKDGRYACKYDGRFFYGKTQGEAQDKRDHYIKEMYLGYDPDLSETTFYEYAMTWLDAFRADCNPRQRRQYETMIEYAANTLKKTYIRTITATDIKVLYNSLKGYSESHIHKFRTTIRGIFTAAMRDRIIISNPTENIKPPTGTTGEHRCLERWEQQLVVDTYREHDFGLCAMTMMLAGLRRGEVICLNIDRDVDFEKNVIHVREAASFSEGNQAVISKGKTDNAQRTIPLNAILANALRDHHGLLCGKANGTVLSMTGFDRKYESYIGFLERKVNGCYKRWYGKTKEHKQLLKEGKELPPWHDVNIRCHDFRVTFCTMCYEADIPIKTLQAWMGHADVTMILKVYAKLTAERENLDITRLNNLTNERFAG